MSTWLVEWSIDVDADEATTPVEAAAAAWRSMRREDSIACVFTVTAPDGTVVEVDLAGERA